MSEGDLRHRTGLVLSGGGARGAYEAGVVAYLRQELEPALGRSFPIHVIAGTSVGAINACYLATHAHLPFAQAGGLVERWKSLHVSEVLRFGIPDVLRMGREMLGRANPDSALHGGLVDPAALEGIVMRGTHWPWLGRNIRAGLLDGLAISATEVAHGRTAVFIQQRGGGLPEWHPDPNLKLVAARIGPRHALASAAIPLLFPPVTIGGRLFVDGGLRMNVPLSPALRMGATRVIVISMRYMDPPRDESAREKVPQEELKYATAPFLVGKALNALMLDSTDQDMGRLRAINDLLSAGTRAYGSSFFKVMSDALPDHSTSRLRYVRNILVRPSQDIGRMAAKYARQLLSSRRAKGLPGLVLGRLVDPDSEESDLLSYLLFDGGFAEQLIELGRSDARRLRDEWIRFFSDEPESTAESSQWQPDR